MTTTVTTNGINFNDGTTMTTTVPDEGTVGSYALLQFTGTSDRAPGGTASGSNLKWAGTEGGTYGDVVGYGTWRAMGYSKYNAGSPSLATTLWIRIS